MNGKIIHRCGVKVLDGTENWHTASNNVLYSDNFFPTDIPNDYTNPISTHYRGASRAGYTLATMPVNSIKSGTSSSPRTVVIKDSERLTPEALKTWLADQYAAGTPVIVIYPLATPTTESVAGQTLQVTAGDNVLEITQASLNGLELEAEYQAGQ